MGIDLSLISIEILTALLGLAILALGLIVPSNSRHGIGYVTCLFLMGILGYSILTWDNVGVVFGDMYIVDQYSIFFKQIFLIAAILVVMGSMRYVNEMGSQSEYYSMIVFSTLGMMVMASAGDFMTLYMGLELMTIAFTILVCFRKLETKSVEAAIKYILLAGMSSAVLLYGLSLIYGLTGTVQILDVAKVIRQGDASPLLLLGVVMLIAGFGFKISAVPFHMWSPDVYEGAPTPVTSFLAVGSKAASFAILLRVFISGLPGIWSSWSMVIAILAAVTIIFGNLVAIPQTNIKRMLAFSSIGQAGYILVGLITATEAGVKGVMFYALLYVFSTVGAFTVVSSVFDDTGSEEIKDYAGMSQRSPLLAAVLTMSMLSMAGIPPLAGFVGKFYLFSTIVDNYLWLAFIGLVMSMISVYYYLRVALVMYRDKAIDETPIKVSSSVAITLIITMVITVIIGVYPGPIAEISNSAAHSFFLMP